MVEVLGETAAASVSVETDQWVPLTVKWDTPNTGQALFLYFEDPGEGFVELKIDSDTGALLGFVILNLPQTDGKERSLDRVYTRPGIPLLDRELWPWKVTPDYRELIDHYCKITCPLSASVNLRRLTVWFGSGSPVLNLRSADVTATISDTGSLLAITAPWPTEATELWPLPTPKATAQEPPTIAG